MCIRDRLSQAVCWGAVEQAAHSHQTVEALLFHGWMIYGAVGCKNRCSFFAGRAQEMCIRDRYKGAMPEHLLQSKNIPLIEEYQKAAQGEIRYITVSPEVDGMVEDLSLIHICSSFCRG